MKRKLAAAAVVLSCGMAVGLALSTHHSQAARKYTISKSTKPCNSTYQRLASYNGNFKAMKKYKTI